MTLVTLQLGRLRAMVVIMHLIVARAYAATGRAQHTPPARRAHATVQHAIARAAVLTIAAPVPRAAHATSPDGAFDVHLDGGWLLDSTGMASSCVVSDLKLILRAIDSSKNQINVFSSSPAWASAKAFLTNLT
jgi:hypothetical protein